MQASYAATLKVYFEHQKYKDEEKSYISPFLPISSL